MSAHLVKLEARGDRRHVVNDHPEEANFPDQVHDASLVGEQLLGFLNSLLFEHALGAAAALREHPKEPVDVLTAAAKRLFILVLNDGVQFFGQGFRRIVDKTDKGEGNGSDGLVETTSRSQNRLKVGDCASELHLVTVVVVLGLEPHSEVARARTRELLDCLLEFLSGLGQGAKSPETVVLCLDFVVLHREHSFLRVHGNLVPPGAREPLDRQFIEDIRLDLWLVRQRHDSPFVEFLLDISVDHAVGSRVFVLTEFFFDVQLHAEALVHFLVPIALNFEFFRELDTVPECALVPLEVVEGGGVWLHEPLLARLPVSVYAAIHARCYSKREMDNLPGLDGS